MALHFLLMSGFLVFPVMMVEQLGINASDYPLTLLLILVASFVAAVPLMMATDRWPERRKALMVLMVGVLGLSLVGMQIQPAAWWLALVLGLFFVAFNVLEMMLPNLVSLYSSENMRGAAMGVHTSAQFFGAFAGGAVGGWLITMADSSMMLWVNAGIVLSWFVVLLWLSPTPRQPSVDQSSDAAATSDSPETV